MIKDARTANHSDTIKAMVGEKIVGVICDYAGNWHLIVESGHSFVMGAGAPYWVDGPEKVKFVIEQRKKDLVTWQQEALDLMAIPEPRS